MDHIGSIDFGRNDYPAEFRDSEHVAHLKDNPTEALYALQVWYYEARDLAHGTHGGETWLERAASDCLITDCRDFPIEEARHIANGYFVELTRTLTVLGDEIGLAVPALLRLWLATERFSHPTAVSPLAIHEAWMDLHRLQYRISKSLNEPIRAIAADGPWHSPDDPRPSGFTHCLRGQKYNLAEWILARGDAKGRRYAQLNDKLRTDESLWGVETARTSSEVWFKSSQRYADCNKRRLDWEASQTESH